MGAQAQKSNARTQALSLILHSALLLLATPKAHSEPWSVCSVSHAIMKLVKEDTEASFYEAKVLQDIVLQGRFTWVEGSVGPYFSEIQFPAQLARDTQWCALEALRSILGSRHQKEDSRLIFMRYRTAVTAFNLRFRRPDVKLYSLKPPINCASLLSVETAASSLKHSPAIPSIEK